VDCNDVKDKKLALLDMLNAELREMAACNATKRIQIEEFQRRLMRDMRVAYLRAVYGELLDVDP